MTVNKAQKSVLIVVAVLGSLMLAIGIGFGLRVGLSQDVSKQAEAVTAVGDSFPVPAGARIAVPPSSGTDPVTSSRSWETDESLDQACTTWREAFRSWVTGADQSDVGGNVEPGISCTFKAKRTGHDVSLQLAKVGETKPVATLTVTEPAVDPGRN